jgi:eukaryotic translation initiation factor 2C
MYDMMVEAMNHFCDQNSMPPERIIMFRDGVSEGEFETVRDRERADIRRAIDQVFFERYPKHTGLKIQIVFLIVGKRYICPLRYMMPDLISAF